MECPGTSSLCLSSSHPIRAPSIGTGTGSLQLHLLQLQPFCKVPSAWRAQGLPGLYSFQLQPVCQDVLCAESPGATLASAYYSSGHPTRRAQHGVFWDPQPRPSTALVSQSHQAHTVYTGDDHTQRPFLQSLEVADLLNS